MPITNKSSVWPRDSFHYKHAKKVARNTWKFLPDTNDSADFGIILHHTTVIRFEAGKITLDSGGWQSVTTKDRINRFLPGYRVYSDRGTWRVYRGNSHPWGADNPLDSIVFYDGMILPDAFAARDKSEVEAERIKMTNKEIGRLCKRLGNLPDSEFPANAENFPYGPLIYQALVWRGYQAENMVTRYDRGFGAFKDISLRALRAFLKHRAGLAYR